MLLQEIFMQIQTLSSIQDCGMSFTTYLEKSSFPQLKSTTGYLSVIFERARC